MPIVPSRSGRIQELLGRLASESPAARDSAVAGLTLLGSRVVEPVGAFLPTATRTARLAALEVLDGIRDRAALAPILALAGDAEDAVALRALEAAGSRLDPRAVPALTAILEGPAPAPRRRGAALALARLQACGFVEALDPLAVRLLDEREDASLRLAILDALLTLDPPLAAAARRPLLKKLASSADPEIAARARPSAGASARREDPRDVDERLVAELVAPGSTPGAAGRVMAALTRRGASAIPALQRALERLGPVRPGRTDGTSLRARAAIHEALAGLDSRVALYDLRETLEARPRSVMPVLLRAAGRIGDATVVAPLARVVAEEKALLDACADVLAAIVARERLRKTSAALKAVRPADREAFDLLWERAKAGR